MFIDEKLYAYVQNGDSIMHRYYSNYFELHLPLFWCRVPLISSENIAEYCDIWLYQFITMLQNVFDRRNEQSFFEKMKYNQRMINTEEFRFCVNNASGKKENPLMLKLLRKGNYYLYWTVERLSDIKNNIIRRN